VKGLFDKRAERQHILVTGSGRLDFYRFGGDSLQGRYHLLRLHPLSVAELDLHSPAQLKSLLALGGFPEPFFVGSLVEARRWSRDYRTRLVREDIASLERVQDLGRLELLAQRLPDLVGSPLSVNALREDLQVGHPTVESWLAVLERTYSIFRLAPLGLARVRAVKKERKHYQMDWSLVATDAARFENLVACHLLKWVQFEEDTQGRDLELRYFRDRDGREVDFVVTENRKPILLVEAQVGGCRRRSQSALPEGALPRSCSLADQRHRQAELSNTRRHSRSPRARAAAHPRVGTANARVTLAVRAAR
jgi:predicted AAA+ superfamily ATPase